MENMFKEKPQILEKQESKEIEKRPKFLDWFEDFKNSISGWPEKFFKDKKMRNAIVWGAIPFSVFQAGKLETRAEDITSALVHQQTMVETYKPVEIVKADELIALEEKDKNAFSQRINLELEAFRGISNSFNSSIDIPKRMNEKIQKANDNFKLSTKDKNLKQYFTNGNLGIKELAKLGAAYIASEQMSVIRHELGHQEELSLQGAKDINVDIGFLSGVTHSKKAEDTNQAAVSKAGVEANRKFSEFIVDNLRVNDSESQILAILALTARTDAFRYALKTHLTSPETRDPADDINNYSNKTDIPVEDLLVGLAADFAFDPDNWRLLKMALGEKGVIFPKETIKLFYELGENSPVMGVKFKKVF